MVQCLAQYTIALARPSRPYVPTKWKLCVWRKNLVLAQKFVGVTSVPRQPNTLLGAGHLVSQMQHQRQRCRGQACQRCLRPAV